MPINKSKLIKKEDIKEEMRLIKGSNTDYITPTSKIYKHYGNDMYYPKKILSINITDMCIQI